MSKRKSKSHNRPLNQRVRERYGSRCYICRVETLSRTKIGRATKHQNAKGRKKIKGRLFTKDHVHPVSRGGPNFLWNLRPCCSGCNTRKSGDLRIGEPYAAFYRPMFTVIPPKKYMEAV